MGCGGQDGPTAGSQKIGDIPAIRLHTDQSEIDSGQLDLDELLQRGEALMVASFNTLDGAGRPETTGAGGPRARREIPDNFNRISSPDANACSGCHNQPRPGDGGDNVANVFVLAQVHEFATFDGDQAPHDHEHSLQTVGNERATVGMFESGSSNSWRER